MCGAPGCRRSLRMRAVRAFPRYAWYARLELHERYCVDAMIGCVRRGFANEPRWRPRHYRQGGNSCGQHQLSVVPLCEEEMFMAFPGYATPEGTARYAARLQGTVAQDHFREFQGLKISSIGLGT